jgi:hypothetical protein
VTLCELLKAERQDVRRQVLLSLIAEEEAKLLQLANTSSTDVAGSVMNCAGIAGRTNAGATAENPTIS